MKMKNTAAVIAYLAAVTLLSACGGSDTAAVKATTKRCSDNCD